MSVVWVLRSLPTKLFQVECLVWVAWKHGEFCSAVRYQIQVDYAGGGAHHRGATGGHQQGDQRGGMAQAGLPILNDSAKRHALLFLVLTHDPLLHCRFRTRTLLFWVSLFAGVLRVEQFWIAFWHLTRRRCFHSDEQLVIACQPFWFAILVDNVLEWQHSGSTALETVYFGVLQTCTVKAVFADSIYMNTFQIFWTHTFCNKTLPCPDPKQHILSYCCVLDILANV